LGAEKQNRIFVGVFSLEIVLFN